MDRPASQPAPRFLADGHDFILDGIRFKVLRGTDRSRRTDEEGVALLKGWPFVEQELSALQGLDVRRMAEFGVAQGGSAALWAALLPLERYVGLDLRPVEIPFPPEVTGHRRWPAIRLHGGISQDDRSAVERILNEDVAAALDLVIDDASHQYQPSLSTFEITFPRLRPGGAYILEDWAWAHKDGPWQIAGHPWHGRPSLANLVLQLLLLSGSRPDIIPRVAVTHSFALFWRGPAALAHDFAVDPLLDPRSRAIKLI